MSLLARGAEPPRDCPLCPRLYAFIAGWRMREPDWFNAPVPTFLPAGGEAAARVLIVGLAPGLRGANRTGRPFTGDYAGTLLYETLIRFGFARGRFEARPDDGLELVDAAITNAVRCVPPENKPETTEIRTCREHFLVPTVARFPNLKAIVTLGKIAHDSTVRSLGLPLRAIPFIHGAEGEAGPLRVFSSYHCSRYNTNTGVLTEEMFVDVFRRVREYLGGVGE
ncbi:uracil-DNA glycosylase [Chelativorans sp.]|uniref:uracil-DNA glycosylase n=1 Tax=Chelativorans sp. TaxID=2203393 RepID=UPI00281121AD|nr:uracil-DNA glycosylase [Chelativorans sp.]